MNDLIVLAMLTLFCGLKAGTEAWSFHAPEEAKKTVFVWAVGSACLWAAFGISLLLNHLS